MKYPSGKIGKSLPPLPSALYRSNGLTSYIRATVFSVVMTICSLIVLGLFLFLVLAHDPAPIGPDLLERIAAESSDLWPKPSERFSYIILVLASPVLILTWGWTYWRHAARINFNLLSWISACMVGYFWLVAWMSPPIRRMFLPEWRNQLSLDYGYTIFAVLLGFYLLKWNLKQRDNGHTPLLLNLCGIILWSGFCCLSWRFFGISTIDHSAQNTVNFNAVLYSVVEAVAGKIPLVDFVPQYGWYGIFLAPWLRTIGLTVWTFTGTCSVLQWLTFLAAFFSASRFMRNRLLIACAFFTLLAVTANWVPLSFAEEPYFQYWPIRFFCPGIGLLFLSFWLRFKEIKYSLLLSSFCGAAVLWNLDSGIPLWGAWLGYLVFDLLSNAYLDLSAFKRAASQGRIWERNWIHLALGLLLPPCVFLSLFFAITGSHLIQGDASLNFRLLTQYQRIFFGAGFYMIPIPLKPHPWQVPILIDLIALAVALIGTLYRRRDATLDFLFFMGVMGLGLFTYYEGRSHDLVLTAVIWPSVISFFVLSDWCHSLDLRNAGLRVIFSKRLLYAFLLPAHLLGALTLVSQGRGLVTYYDLAVRHFIADPKSTAQNTNLDSVASVIQEIKKRYLKPGQAPSAVFLSGHQAVLLAETGTDSLLRGPGLGEMILKSDWKNWFDQLEQAFPQYLFIDEIYVQTSYLSKDAQLSHKLQEVRAKYPTVNQVGFLTVLSKD
jgi:hypothetical protein